MAFFPPIPLIRKNHIIKKLRRAGATSEGSAITFTEAGIINPNAFSGITDKMLLNGILVKTSEGKYYLR